MGKTLELIGQRFGKLLVTSFSHTGKGYKKYWNCSCDCGNTTIVSRSELRQGKTKSCGCIKESQAERIIGRIFGRLYVERFDYRDNRGNSYYFCTCACGNETVVRGTELLSGGTKSCGCYAENRDLLIRKYNEESALIKARETLYSLKIRCYNKESKLYKNYGGRGISICSRWLEKRKV